MGVVSYFDAEATRLAMGGIYLFEERSRNVNMIAGLLFGATGGKVR
jgi:hypothetical protein